MGLVVWQAGFVLADLLLRRPPFGSWHGAQVLDLGCGTGRLVGVGWLVWVGRWVWVCAWVGWVVFGGGGRAWGGTSSSPLGCSLPGVRVGGSRQAWPVAGQVRGRTGPERLLLPAAAAAASRCSAVSYVDCLAYHHRHVVLRATINTLFAVLPSTRAGLVGMLLALAGAEVTLTDQPHIVPLAEANAKVGGCWGRMCAVLCLLSCAMLPAAKSAGGEWVDMCILFWPCLMPPPCPPDMLTGQSYTRPAPLAGRALHLGPG